MMNMQREGEDRLVTGASHAALEMNKSALRDELLNQIEFISIRGEDRDNPVILFLHGGPGDVTNPWGYLAFRPWLEYFTVVQWDQRGAGSRHLESGAAA